MLDCIAQQKKEETLPQNKAEGENPFLKHCPLISTGTLGYLYALPDTHTYNFFKCPLEIYASFSLFIHLLVDI